MTPSPLKTADVSNGWSLTKLVPYQGNQKAYMPFKKKIVILYLNLDQYEKKYGVNKIDRTKTLLKFRFSEKATKN